MHDAAVTPAPLQRAETWHEPAGLAQIEPEGFVATAPVAGSHVPHGWSTGFVVCEHTPFTPHVFTPLHALPSSLQTAAGGFATFVQRFATHASSVQGLPSSHSAGVVHVSGVSTSTDVVL